MRHFWREFGIVLLIAAALTSIATYPLVLKLGHVGRLDSGDGLFSIWNVAWVARALVVDPRHVFDANIFYPHRTTLAYSENNIGAGAMAIPAYWATRNPYFAHNFVLMCAFILSASGMYYLVRYLTGDRRAAAMSAVCFAFCPYIFARTAEIQLLMTAGLPFSMLAFHRMADRPTTARGFALGAALAGQAIFCGYYGVFVILMVGFATFVVATTRQRWTDLSYWRAIGVGAAAASILVLPVFLPYVMLQRVTGFSRPLDQAVRFSANWSAYFASSAYAHRWLLRVISPWNEVLFPGVVATSCGLAGLWITGRSRDRELAIVYGGLAALAGWASFGPDAGLYTALYKTVPLFEWLRAPARLGLVVVFALSVMAGSAVAAWLPRLRRGTLVGIALAAVAMAELITPLRLVDVPPQSPVYRILAALPPGPVIEMPFFYRKIDFHRHTLYMLNSTTHWMPLMNGYSDYTPADFLEHVMPLRLFPSREAFKLIEPNKVRYAVFHMNFFNTENRNQLLAGLQEFAPYLLPLYVDDEMRLYEITGFPP